MLSVYTQVIEKKGFVLDISINPIGAITERVDAGDLDQDEFSLLAHLARYAFVVRQCRGDEEIIEVGSGTGYGANFMAKHVKSVVAYEPFVEPQYLENKWVRGNLSFTKQLNLSQKYDKIVSLEVIEHMPRNEADDFIKLLISLGKDNSIWFISTPRRLPDEERTENRKRAHPFEYNFEDFQILLQTHFEITHLFSQNDGLISFQNSKMAWNFIAICTRPKLRES